MKKIIFLLLGILFFSMNIQAQKRNAIKTNLFSPIIRTGHLLYEMAINDDMSLQLGFFYTGYNDRDSDVTLNGWGITPEFRYYLSETPAPSGTYLAPSFRYSKFDVKDPANNEEGTLTVFGFAINFGKQVILKDVVSIDAFAGPSYNFRNLESTGTIDTPVTEANGFGIRVGLAIGIVF